MEKINIIHVDNLQAALDSFQQLAGQRENINYVQGFTNPVTACQYVLQHKEIDIGFLDIEMEPKTGLWLAEQVKMLPINIIFLTADTGYTLQAFEVCAIDYMLKPATLKSLDEALFRYQTRKIRSNKYKQQIEEFTNLLTAKQPPKRLFISTVGEIMVVQIKDIMYLASSDNYTTIYTKQDKHLSTKRISTYEEILAPNPDFVRINRGLIVNKNFMKSILRDSLKQKYSVIMSNDDVLAISYKKREEIMAKLEN